MDFKTLNKEQYEAVSAEKGPLLILAGAGSGKTRALTYRIAYLIRERGVHPGQILALTFTNKAAMEMKERLYELVGTSAQGIWMGTFHSIAIRILRMHYTEIGFSKDFVVYDAQDQKTLITQVMKELNMDTEKYPPKMVRSIISQAKSQMVSFNEYRQYLEEYFHEVYLRYEARMRAAEAMDFDNILLHLVTLFHDHEAIRRTYAERFYEVLVDEYQDTNRVQYHLVHQLTQDRHNVVVVGDVDQSIYGWRGADIRNILEFQKDFKGATVIKLEQNYRSTKNILEAANAVIEHNKKRPPKALWTDAESGPKIILYHAGTDQEEAEYIVSDIYNRMREGVPLKEMAILYRAHAQTRLFEERLRYYDIHYQIVGGLKFFDRKEIKDVLAYLRVLVNPKDDLSFLRALSIPRRGLGDKFIEELSRISRGEELSLYEAAHFGLDNVLFSARQAGSLKAFLDLYEPLREQLEQVDAYEAVRRLLDTSGYMKMLEDSRLLEDQSRLDNIGELLNDVLVYTQTENGSLDDYLIKVSLLSEVDEMDEKDAITLMTLHSSKGLEFPYVYLSGMDDNIFPSFLSKEEVDGIEEERRLCYVGFTRAKKRLVLTRADRRYRFGQLQLMNPSLFLAEIPKELLEEKGVHKKSAFQETIPFLKMDPLQKSTQFQVGQKVHHQSFGEGIVLSFDPQSKIIQILFDASGLKKLHTDYAPLTAR